MKFSIPVYQPTLDGNEARYVMECISSTWISSRGPFVEKFESSFSSEIGAKYATTVSNGTVALHLALIALGIGPGDEVIVPSLTYIASVNTIVHAGAQPVFAEVSADTWQVDPESVERNITAKTKALMIVHLYGQASDMDPLLDIARRHRLMIIEDCAEAIGTRYKGRHVGTFGDIATFSFFGNKTITTGEGGMVVTSDRTLMGRCKHLKGQGLAAHREYWHDAIGYNYRMTNVAAAIGLAQLERMAQFIKRKREIASLYISNLVGLPLQFQQEQCETFHSYWMFSVLLPEDEDRDRFRQCLAEAGIETRPLFYPVHTMPMYSQKFLRLPVSEGIAWRGVNLPSWPGLSDEQVLIVCSTIRNYFLK